MELRLGQKVRHKEIYNGKETIDKDGETFDGKL